jgi:hypothetical protein
VFTGADMRLHRTALKDGSAVLAFFDELERWISRPSPAREEGAVLNTEIVLHVHEDMSSLVGNISGLASQMQLWPEPLPQPIELYRPRSASRTGASAASVANRGTGLVLAFWPRKAVLHSDSIAFKAGVRGLIDERESVPGLHNSTMNESGPDLVHSFPGKRPILEVTDAIFLVRDTGKAATRRVKPYE